MRSPSQFFQAVRRRLWLGFKHVIAYAGASDRDFPDILFVFGCQRSGTTMIQDVFERDPRCRVYRDISALSRRGGSEGIRLNPLDEVEEEFRQARAAFVTAKPLADSHRVKELLDRFPTARAIWMFRDFRDVAGSDLRAFGPRNGVKNLEPMIRRDPTNWRSAGVSERVSAVLQAHHLPEQDPHDAAALFWYARNELFFEQELGSDPRVMPLGYERFVEAPLQGMEEIYTWLDRPFPGKRLVANVHAGSVGKAAEFPLSPAVTDLCSSLMSRLEYEHAEVRDHRPELESGAHRGRHSPE